MEIALSNILLSTLSEKTLERLSMSLESVELGLKQPLEKTGEPIETVYFFESGVVSRVVSNGDERIEVGITGREGATGVPLVHGWPRALNEAFMQVEGQALRMPASLFREHLASLPEFRDLMLRFSLVQASQTAHSLLANGRFTILERAARWILMCHDRVDENEFRLTHEFMALMLGVRRAGVTSEMHTLEGERAIRNRRGIVAMRDRARLLEIAGGAYGAPEAHYAEIIGKPFQRPAAMG